MTDIRQDSEEIPKVDESGDELSTQGVIFETQIGRASCRERV